MSSPQTTALIIYHTTPDYFRLLRGPWHIVTVRKRKDAPHPIRYDLRFNGLLQRSIRTHITYDTCHAPGLNLMIRECIHLNSINAKPRPAIQCAADSPNPEKYLAAHAW